MSQVNTNTPSVNNNAQAQNTSATQQASQADNKNVQEFNKLLTGKKHDPAAERLFKKSEKMLMNKSGVLAGKEQLTPEMKLSLLSGKQQEGKLLDNQFQNDKAFNPQGSTTQASAKQASTGQGFNDGDEFKQNMPSAENLLASINHTPLNQEGTQVKVDSTQSTQAPLDSSKVQELADRILVATKSDGSNEVRLTLSDKALAGTEVIINKSVDNMLTVRFETTNANSFQTLVAAQDALKSTLESSNSNVKVEVSQERHDPQGESRNKREYTPEDEQEA